MSSLALTEATCHVADACSPLRLTSTAPYTVTIGSKDEIFANQDASYLFAHIGFGSSCTATQTVTGLELLNTRSVTNMSYMFNNFGYRKMTGLTLPTAFNTSNVTNMSSMFEGCGQLVMTTITDICLLYNLC